MEKDRGVTSEQWWRFKREHGYPVQGKAYAREEWEAIRAYEKPQAYLSRFRLAERRHEAVRALDSRIRQFVDDGLDKAVEYRGEAFLKVSQKKRTEARRLERNALKIEADIIELLESDKVDYFAL